MTNATAYDAATVRTLLAAIAVKLTDETVEELHGAGALDTLAKATQRTAPDPYGPDTVTVCTVCEGVEGCDWDCPVENLRRWSDGLTVKAVRS